MAVAHAVGVDVFVTGGIGGVHRGAESTWDASADLYELGRTPVAVVCAGAKSILDLPKTLEVLESQGVPVVGVRTTTFPAFFSNTSNLPVSCTCQNIEELAAVVLRQLRGWPPVVGMTAPLREGSATRAATMCGLGGGLVVAVAVPQQHQVPEEAAERAIKTALAEMEEQRVAGRQVTPFLLRRVNELSGGQTLQANKQLIHNNAHVGAMLADRCSAELWKAWGRQADKQGDHHNGGTTEGLLGKQQQHIITSGGRHNVPGGGSVVSQHSATLVSEENNVDMLLNSSSRRVVVVGSICVDITAVPCPLHQQSPPAVLRYSSSTPGRVFRSVGGVGHNVCAVARRVGLAVQLITAVGGDEEGAELREYMRREMGGDDGVVVLDGGGEGAVRTGRYVALMDEKGELLGAVADTGVIEKALTPLKLREMWQRLTATTELAVRAANAGSVHTSVQPEGAASYLVICDTNLSADSLLEMCRMVSKGNKHGSVDIHGVVWVDPVSVGKAHRAAACISWIQLLAPDRRELKVMAETVGKNRAKSNGRVQREEEREAGKLRKEVMDDMLYLQQTSGLPYIFTSCGALGAVLSVYVQGRVGTSQEISDMDRSTTAAMRMCPNEGGENRCEVEGFVSRGVGTWRIKDGVGGNKGHLMEVLRDFVVTIDLYTGSLIYRLRRFLLFSHEFFFRDNR
eukprot:GHVS01010335.1.p1 GENE.GHVS01010335.1~~GHVS01010335.1.p1  ORF type:complete len:684 (+),score=143.17 GHVS01010335.1:458-2509(+)